MKVRDPIGPVPVAVTQPSPVAVPVATAAKVPSPFALSNEDLRSESSDDGDKYASQATAELRDDELHDIRASVELLDTGELSHSRVHAARCADQRSCVRAGVSELNLLPVVAQRQTVNVVASDLPPPLPQPRSAQQQIAPPDLPSPREKSEILEVLRAWGGQEAVVAAKLGDAERVRRAIDNADTPLSPRSMNVVHKVSFVREWVRVCHLCLCVNWSDPREAGPAFAAPITGRQ